MSITNKQAWTFGIIYGNNTSYLKEVICSIQEQQIENYEIILVGNSSLLSDDIKNYDKIILIDFNESIKPMWITKKKNLIAQYAKYDNISLHHDYIKLSKNWYKNFVEFGNDWDVVMTRIEKNNGSRYRDWVTWDPVKFVDYKDDSKTKQMYVSGSYFCIKKEFFIKNPFNEDLTWGWGEDVEWSKRIREVWNYKCNWKSKVLLCKDKESYPTDDSDLSKNWYEKEQL